MFRRFVVLSTFMAFYTLPAAADQLYMYDGSVVSGEVTGLYDDVLSIETSFAGRLDVDKTAVKGIKTDLPMITETNGGERIAGMLAYDETNGQRIYSKNLGAIAVSNAQIHTIWQRDGAAPEVIVLREQQAQQQNMVAKVEGEPAADVAEIQETAAVEADDVWSGSIKFGFAGADGNTKETNFDGKAVANRETEFDRLKLSLQGRFERDDGEETKNEIIGAAKLEHDITDRLFAFTSLNMEHDKFEDIDLRSNLTGGLGYFLIKEDHHELKPRLGVGYEVTAYGNAPTEKEVVLSAGYDYRVDMMETLQFTHSLTYLPTLDSIADDYRIDSDVALAYPIDADKSWNVELGLRNQYDSMPSGDIEKLDTYYSLGLSRKFE